MFVGYLKTVDFVVVHIQSLQEQGMYFFGALFPYRSTSQVHRLLRNFFCGIRENFPVFFNFNTSNITDYHALSKLHVLF